MNNFAEWLRGHREEKGWTRGELARRAEIPENTLYRYEQGYIKPGFDAMVAICRALSVPFLGDATITLDNNPSKVQNLVGGIGNLEVPDKTKAQLLLKALTVLEAELGGGPTGGSDEDGVGRQ